MDLNTCLPKSEGSGSIIVVMDRFSKHGTFIVAPPDVTANDTTKLFFKNVVKYWGVPNVIVSDRDLRVTGRFWTELFKIIGTDLKFSKNFHPQMDRQTERVNALLELYPWHYMSANQHDWNKLFDGSSPTIYKTMKECHEQADLARASLDKAAKKMKKWEDERRRHIEFEVGDQVMVKLLPQQFKSLRKIVEYLSKADLVETKCHTEDHCRDKFMTSGIRASRFEEMANEGEIMWCIEIQGSKLSQEDGGCQDIHVGVEGASRESHKHLEELGFEFAKLREVFKIALNVLGGNLGREIHDLRELKDLRVNVSLCKRYMASGGGNTSKIPPKVEVPKPSPFVGKRKASSVDDFLWEMEQYLEGVNV
ncbi:putative nucleotidyltransferase, ribonuclease H, partial [Tanacetum coccineum]